MRENSKEFTNCELPKCDTCDFGKVHHITDKIKTTKKNTMKDQDLNNDNISPR